MLNFPRVLRHELVCSYLLTSVGPEFLELQCLVIEKKIEFITLVFSVLVFREKGVGNQLFYLLEFEIIFKLVTYFFFEAGVCVCGGGILRNTIHLF